MCHRGVRLCHRRIRIRLRWVGCRLRCWRFGRCGVRIRSRRLGTRARRGIHPHRHRAGGAVAGRPEHSERQQIQQTRQTVHMPAGSDVGDGDQELVVIGGRAVPGAGGRVDGGPVRDRQDAAGAARSRARTRNAVAQRISIGIEAAQHDRLAALAGHRADRGKLTTEGRGRVVEGVLEPGQSRLPCRRGCRRCRRGCRRCRRGCRRCRRRCGSVGVRGRHREGRLGRRAGLSLQHCLGRAGSEP